VHILPTGVGEATRPRRVASPPR